MTAILIVEDEPMMADSLRLQLEHCGYQIAALIGQGDAAVEYCKTTTPPDLVLMDIVLAGRMDGIEAARLIRENYHLPVLYLTAYADDAFFQRAQVTEPYAYLLKPSSSREIQLAIEVALYRHKTEKAARHALTAALSERTEELAVARQNIADTLEHISDAFVSLDTEWRYTYINAKACELLERKPETLIGKCIWDEFPEGVGQSFYHAYHKAMAEQIPIDIEEYYPPWKRWFENRIYPSATGISIFFHDINRRKLTKQALKDSEAALNESQSIAGIGSYATDMQTGLWHSSAMLDQVLGIDGNYTHDLRGWYALIHPENRIQQEAYLRAQILDKNPDVNHEFRIVRHNDQAERWVHALGRIKFDAAGNPLSMRGTLSDITERKQTETQIQSQLDMLHALYAGAHKLSESTDMTGIAHHVTQWCVEVLGVQLAWLGRAEEDGSVSLLAQHPAEHPYPRSITVRWDDTPLGSGPTGLAIRQGKPVFTQEIADNPDFAPWREPALQSAFHSSAAFPLVSRNKPFGALTLYSSTPGFFTAERIALFQAIAHQASAALVNIELYDEVRAYAAELEQRVALRTADLDASNQALEAYSYSVSHDLRAPLRAMQGFAQALQEDYGETLDATGKNYLQRIAGAAARMSTLIQDLLDYSHLSRTDIALKPVSLSTAIREALAQLNGEISLSGAQITIDPALPDVMGNDLILSQILYNLIGNAIKFVPDGTRPVVRIGAEARDERVRIWVEDNGIGIAPEHQARIFRVFERLHGVETYPGTGIGLAIVHKGATRMQGAAGLESAAGKGSRFWVELQKVPVPEKS
jgi:PAS domain S-box-containing protein